MRSNLGDVFAVSLITVIVVAPALLTFALVWHLHLQFVDHPPAQFSKALTFVSMSFFFLFPVRTAYRSYQSARFKRTVDRLERLWQQSI
ncbi:hypothetical protein H6F89_10180 [Cyanobacteria bacterium FACHB-63]|nr:hypothetical protein [Cyanobacteria bacterium FACHB-63]